VRPRSAALRHHLEIDRLLPADVREAIVWAIGVAEAEERSRRAEDDTGRLGPVTERPR